MSKRFLCFLIIVWTIQLNAQTCERLLTEHLTKNPTDATIDPDAFCSGVQAAEADSSWSLLFATDQGLWSNCEVESYERFGVHLMFTGYVLVPEQESFNKGYNAFVLQQMNEERPGLHDSLGILPKGMRLFDADLLNEFKTLLILEKQSDSVIILRLDVPNVKASYFETLEGVTILEARSKRVYAVEELVKGVQLFVPLQKKIILRPDFTRYIYPEKICTTDVIIVPISMD